MTPETSAHRHGPDAALPARRTGERVPAQAATDPCRASAIRLRAQRREVLPNASASLRSDNGLPSRRLAR
jgi:hypothetical protein